MDPLFENFKSEYKNMNLSDLVIINAIIIARSKSDNEEQIKKTTRDLLNREVISYIRTTNDKKVRNNFILKYINVYKSVIKHNPYLTETVNDIEEYESEVFEVMLTTLYNYNLNSKTQYITYLYSSIWGALYRTYSKNYKLANYPYSYISNLSKVNKVINQHLMTTGRFPSYRFISSKTDLSVKQVKKILQQDYTEESLNKVNNENEEIYYEIQDPESTKFVEEILGKEDLNKLLLYIKKILPPSQYEFFVLYFGLGCKPKTRAELASEYNISISAVSSRLSGVIEKLKDDRALIKYLNGQAVDITDLTINFYELFPYDKEIVDNIFDNLNGYDKKYLKHCFGQKFQILRKYSDLDNKVLYIVNKMKSNKSKIKEKN